MLAPNTGAQTPYAPGMDLKILSDKELIERYGRELSFHAENGGIFERRRILKEMDSRNLKGDQLVDHLIKFSHAHREVTTKGTLDTTKNRMTKLIGLAA